jgi:hypothetical protein
MSEYIGKFVCYDQMDGGACWGRIKDEAEVNTMNGYKEVFILEGRYVRYLRTKNVKNFRRFYPGFAEGDLEESKAVSTDENDSQMFLEVRKVKGDSTLRKEMIDLENDIVDLDELLEVVDDELLFKSLLTVSDPCDGKSAAEIGLKALLRSPEISDKAADVLRRRLGLD